MISLNKWLCLSVLSLLLSPLGAQAEDNEVECSYQTHLWGTLKSGAAGVTAQDQLKVLVVGQVKNGDSTWYSIMTGPKRTPELVPKAALNEPLPSGTCAKDGYIAGIAKSLKKAKEDAKEELGLDRLSENEADPNWSKDQGVSPPKPDNRIFANSVTGSTR